MKLLKFCMLTFACTIAPAGAAVDSQGVDDAMEEIVVERVRPRGITVTQKTMDRVYHSNSTGARLYRQG